MLKKQKKTVTLVVNWQEKTQDEAKQNALKSAIEQQKKVERLLTITISDCKK